MFLTSKKLFLIFIILIFYLLFSFNIRYCITPLFTLNHINKPDPFDKTEKHILLWTKFWKNATWNIYPETAITFGPDVILH